MRKLALILAMLLVAVVAGTVHVHTQDEDEQGYVESLVQRLLSAEGRPVTVQGISIGFTGNVSAERVAVRDEAGEWLVIEDFGLDWRPLSLFTDTLVINALTADRMTMLRRPEAAPPAEAPDEAANLIAAEIGTLSIGELEIAAPVAGTPARFTLSGSGSLSASPPEIRLDLAAERIDEVEGRLAADIVFEQETSNLDLSLVLAEGRGGLVQQLLALEGGPTVDLRVDGHGPVSDWSGDLQLALDGEELVSGTARLAGTDAGTMIEAQLAGEFTRLVPSEFHELVQGRAELAAAVMLEEAGALRIESAILRSDVVEISADGGLDFDSGEMLFSLTGQLGYAGPVEIAEAEILRLAFEARLQGTYDAPEWDMNASAESLIAAGVAGRNLTLEISGAGCRSPTSRPRRGSSRPANWSRATAACRRCSRVNSSPISPSTCRATAASCWRTRMSRRPPARSRPPATSRPKPATTSFPSMRRCARPKPALQRSTSCSRGRPGWSAAPPASSPRSCACTTWRSPPT
jgi:autotransporter translocation and assembly factor TamB